MRYSVEPLVRADLVRPRSPAAQLRRKLTVASATAIGVALLLLAAYGELRDTVPNPSNDGIREPVGGLAPIVAQPQNRVGVAIAVALLVIPLIGIIVQALHVGQLDRDRFRSLLSLAGATPQDLRRRDALDTGMGFARGAVLSGPAYLLLWVALGVLPSAGYRLVPRPDVRLAATWVVLVVLLTACGAAAGAKSRRRHRVTPLGPIVSTSRPLDPLYGVTAGCAAALFFIRALLGDVIDTVFVIWAVLEPVLVLFAAANLATAWMSKARPNGRRGDQGVEALAAAQRRSHARAAGRVAAVLFVCGIALDVEAALLVDFTSADDLSTGVMFYVGPTLLAVAGVGVAVVVAVATLGLSITDHLLTSRRAVASAAALGIEQTRLVGVQARVLTAVAVPATITGYLTPALLYTLVNRDFGVTLVLVLVTAPLVGGAVSMGCRLVALSFTARVVDAASALELRTP